MNEKRIPLARWQAHLPSPARPEIPAEGDRPAVPARTAEPGHPAPHTCLPDGTPLTWTAGRADIFEDLTGEYLPRSFHDVSVFLWLASRENSWVEALWIPGSPVTQEVDGPEDVLPRGRFAGLLAQALAWREIVIPAAARDSAMALTARILDREYDPSIEIDEAAIEEEPAEKKSPQAGRTGSSPPPMPYAVDTRPNLPLSFTISPIEPSSPSTGPDSTPSACPLSPPPPAAGMTPS